MPGPSCFGCGCDGSAVIDALELFWTEKFLLSVSRPPPLATGPLISENVKLSVSRIAPALTEPFRIEKGRLSVSRGPVTTTTAVGSRGSTPNEASITSGTPLAASAVEPGLTTVNLLEGVIVLVELANALVATKANVPA